MTADLATTPERKDAWHHIERTRIAFFATLSEANGFRARPLTTQKVEAESRLWFFIAGDGDLAHELASNPRVLVTYTNEDDGFYAALTGTARVVVDAERARTMWSALDEAWFPGGPEDPGLAMVRVDVDHGETWEPTTNRMIQFLSMAAAAVSASTPRRESARHTLM
jgi:general stress protein 26